MSANDTAAGCCFASGSGQADRAGALMLAEIGRLGAGALRGRLTDGVPARDGTVLVAPGVGDGGAGAIAGSTGTTTGTAAGKTGSGGMTVIVSTISPGKFASGTALATSAGTGGVGTGAEAGASLASNRLATLAGTGLTTLARGLEVVTGGKRLAGVVWRSVDDSDGRGGNREPALTEPAANVGERSV